MCRDFERLLLVRDRLAVSDRLRLVRRVARVRYGLTDRVDDQSIRARLVLRQVHELRRPCNALVAAGHIRLGAGFALQLDRVFGGGAVRIQCVGDRRAFRRYDRTVRVLPLLVRGDLGGILLVRDRAAVCDRLRRVRRITAVRHSLADRIDDLRAVISVLRQIHELRRPRFALVAAHCGRRRAGFALQLNRVRSGNAIRIQRVGDLCARRRYDRTVRVLPLLVRGDLGRRRYVLVRDRIVLVVDHRLFVVLDLFLAERVHDLRIGRRYVEVRRRIIDIVLRQMLEAVLPAVLLAERRRLGHDRVVARLTGQGHFDRRRSQTVLIVRIVPDLLDRDQRRFRTMVHRVGRFVDLFAVGGGQRRRVVVVAEQHLRSVGVLKLVDRRIDEDLRILIGCNRTGFVYYRRILLCDRERAGLTALLIREAFCRRRVCLRLRAVQFDFHIGDRQPFGNRIRYHNVVNIDRKIIPYRQTIHDRSSSVRLYLRTCFRRARHRVRRLHQIHIDIS